MERRVLVGKAGLELRSEVGAVADARLPRQGVGELRAFEPVREGAGAQPLHDGGRISRRSREVRFEAATHPGFLAQLVERALGHDHPAPHDGDAIRHQLRLAQDVSGHDESGAAALLLAQVVAHVRGGHRIETSGRLVTEDPVRLVDGGADQGDLLCHAAGVGGQDGARAISQLKAFEERSDALAANLLGNAIQVSKPVEVLGRRVATVQPRLVRHDAESHSHRVKPLGQAKPVELDETGVRAQDPAETAQRGRLACPVLAEQDEDLAALDMQVHAGDGAHVAKALVQTLDPDHGPGLDLF